MNRGRGEEVPSFVVVSVTKPSKNFKIGLGLTTGDVNVRITAVASDGLFAGTPLRIGMVLESVGGTECATAGRAVRLLREAEGRVVVVARDSDGASRGASSSPVVVAVAIRASRGSSLGVDLGRGAGGKVEITSIDPDGPLARSELRVGMKIDAVNGSKYSTYEEGAKLLNEVEGEVRLVASIFDPTPRKNSDEGDDCCCLLNGCFGPADCCGECCLPICVIS